MKTKLFVVGAVALGLIGLPGCSSDSGTNEYLAKDMCHTFVKRRLKAPSTAKFSNETVKGGPSRWTVVGEVDSENSFGAMLRSPYICKEHTTDGGDTWYPDHVELLED